MRLGSRFLLGLAWRLGLLLLAVFAFVGSLERPDLGAARVLAGLLVIGAAAWLWRHIQRTNMELARFIDAVRFGDFSQSFSHRADGSGFSELGSVLDAALKRMRDEKHKLIDANRFYEAVLDDAPTALLTVDNGKVELANKAARRLLIRHQGVRVEDFREYGDAFADALEGGAVNRPRLVPLLSDGVPQTMLVSAAVVHRLGGLVRVVAVQPIQGELNAIEIAAQSDLIRVLTHEIMNSMTPVTSLAHSAAGLMRKVDTGGNADISDARQAVETLARRADGVMNFVESYRQISRAPEVRRRPIDVAAWAEELAALFRADDRAQDVALDASIEQEMAPLEADPDLMSQVLINLLRNAADAARGHIDAPKVALRFQRTPSGRTQIEVEDNGPGVPEGLRQDIFLPFFTTKQKGTGVGLSLARQVVLAHRGSISILDGAGGGALFRIVI
ncbi:ATP-binding protein [Sphingosinicella sp. LHD-64]|uniref:sensor histidine kinase n=1 Tax=Sphingosinicella sp. LHD-64 TaxID=3072139 RepID=UPI00280C6A36|nr:ATP-binding protein [Sphingosinicella sp. LHD-64]MDQ8756096.1 ATP-binding protein [Sphingosinicella sp. LHD-64]